MQMVIYHCRQQVVRCSDCVEVSCEVQVEQLHWNDLAVTATGSATFDTECWTHGRLTKADDCVLANVLEGLTETNSCGGLSLAERRRGDCGDYYILRLWSTLQLVDCIQTDFCEALAVRLQQVLANAHHCGDFGKRLRHALASNFQI